jgi:hypothetical protein
MPWLAPRTEAEELAASAGPAASGCACRQGFEWALVVEFFEMPVAVLGDAEGGDRSGEFGAVAIGVAVEDLFLERALETFDDGVGLGPADEREARRKAVEALWPWQ